MGERPEGDPEESEHAGAFLERLDADAATRLKAAGRRRVFTTGSSLFNEGERSDWVAILLEGRVKIAYYTDDGREVVLGIRGPGELLGELSTIDGQPRSATATALERVEAVLVSSGEFARFLAETPAAAVLMLRMVVERLRDADRKRVEFSAYDTIGRVAKRLIELADRFGEEVDGGVSVAVPLSQEELAAWTGSSREAVSKALRTLRERGWIETHRRRITVLDREALARRAT